MSVNASTLVFKVTFPATGHKATLTVNKDGAAWYNHGKTFTLMLSDNESVTEQMHGANSEITASAANGVWKVFDDANDTGLTITINNGAAGVTANYYTIIFSVTDAGAANGSTIAATYGGATIASGATVLGDAELIITATGIGADIYNYEWSGTASGNENTYTVAAVNAAINAVCTVTGKGPIEITINGEVHQLEDQSVEYYSVGCGADVNILVESAGRDISISANDDVVTDPEIPLKHGDNTIVITIDDYEYTVIVNKPFTFDDMVITRWENTMTLREDYWGDGMTYTWFFGIAPFATGIRYSVSNGGYLSTVGGDYSVEVSNSSGRVIYRSCPSLAVAPKSAAIAVKAYPNPLPSGATIYIEANMDEDILQGAVIEVYSIGGMRIGYFPAHGRITPVNVNYSAGTYVFVLIGKDGERREVMVVVE